MSLKRKVDDLKSLSSIPSTVEEADVNNGSQQTTTTVNTTTATTSTTAPAATSTVSSTSPTQQQQQQQQVLARFKAFEYDQAGEKDTSSSALLANSKLTSLLSLSLQSTPAELRLILDRLLPVGTTDTQRVSFLVDGCPLGEKETVSEALVRLHDGKTVSVEREIEIVYVPLSFFKCFPVTRCTASLSGHADAVLSVQFSPSGASLATGSGDRCVRIWDLATQTAKLTLRGHSGWILALAWSPDERKLASGSLDGELRVWSPEKGAQLGAPLRGHTAHINALAWEPLMAAAAAADGSSSSNSAGNDLCRRLASASKDATVRVWDTHTGRPLFSLTSHTSSVTCLRWGLLNLIYSGSQDRKVHVWAVEKTRGKLVRTLAGHSHWINCMALSSDHVIRSGAFPSSGAPAGWTSQQMVAQARKTGERALAAHGGTERLLTGSDDYHMFLWTPATSKTAVARLSGHQNLINWVGFSPDGRFIASASFDKSVKLWQASTGQFLVSLRGHVSAIYQACFSPDSRFIVTASRDSTVKLWSCETRKLQMDLPGHQDEVFAVDWSPDGQTVASGSKDKQIKLWKK